MLVSSCRVVAAADVGVVVVSLLDPSCFRQHRIVPDTNRSKPRHIIGVVQTHDC